MLKREGWAPMQGISVTELLVIGSVRVLAVATDAESASNPS